MNEKENAEKADGVLRFLASLPGRGHTAVTRPVLREIMLKTEGQMLAAGSLWDIKARHLGAGVYRVSLDELPCKRVATPL